MLVRGVSVVEQACSLGPRRRHGLIIVSIHAALGLRGDVQIRICTFSQYGWCTFSGFFSNFPYMAAKLSRVRKEKLT